MSPDRDCHDNAVGESFFASLKKECLLLQHFATRTEAYSLLYDHLGRPIYISDTNTTTGKERREQLYWDIEGRLMERVITPDATNNPANYSVDIFAHLERGATGWMRLEYVNGGFSSEIRRYIAEDPAGQVAAVWSFTGVGATTPVYTADYHPYGEIRNSAGTIEPALGRGDQIAISGSDARVWSGQNVTTLRTRLVVGQRKVVDARVGANLATSEAQWDGGSLHHVYATGPSIGAGGPSLSPMPSLDRALAPVALPSGRFQCIEFETPSSVRRRRHLIESRDAQRAYCRACEVGSAGTTERVCLGVTSRMLAADDQERLGCMEYTLDPTTGERVGGLLVSVLGSTPAICAIPVGCRDPFFVGILCDEYGCTFHEAAFTSVPEGIFQTVCGGFGGIETYYGAYGAGISR
ncbi:MAG: hypothetical protein DRJ42_06495 [Deltaproteobacteria bacterium]|nr:MAG: hypothetical protein DRJ42_06495 [Deltaproteobacteria bacterium]